MDVEDVVVMVSVPAAFILSKTCWKFRDTNSSLLLQEMTVRLKRDMRIRCIILLSPSDLNPYYSKSLYSSSKCYLSS